MACKGGKFYNAALKSCCKGRRALSVASTIEAYTHQVMGLYSKIDHFTFSSDFLAETTQDFWAGRQLSWSKLLNPFDSAKYENSADFEPFGLYFGRIIDEKGVDRIVDAAGLIDGYQIKIIGNGPDEDMLRERVACEGLDNVEFLGPKWGSELDAILSKAAFVIVPSIWHENFPYVINQAFAFGRPVVGARRGGITELVEDGERGLIFEPDSPEELADAIRRLVAAPEEIRRMGANAKTYSDALFNDETSLANLMRAYGEVL
jgi:glycosyltransferase involved in cell wall biosynthesis